MKRAYRSAGERLQPSLLASANISARRDAGRHLPIDARASGLTPGTVTAMVADP